MCIITFNINCTTIYTNTFVKWCILNCSFFTWNENSSTKSILWGSVTASKVRIRNCSIVSCNVNCTTFTFNGSTVIESRSRYDCFFTIYNIDCSAVHKCVTVINIRTDDFSMLTFNKDHTTIHCITVCEVGFVYNCPISFNSNCTTSTKSFIGISLVKWGFFNVCIVSFNVNCTTGCIHSSITVVECWFGNISTVTSDIDSTTKSFTSSQTNSFTISNVNRN